MQATCPPNFGHPSIPVPFATPHDLSGQAEVIPSHFELNYGSGAEAKMTDELYLGPRRFAPDDPRTEPDGSARAHGIGQFVDFLHRHIRALGAISA